MIISRQRTDRNSLLQPLKDRKLFTRRSYFEMCFDQLIACSTIDEIKKKQKQKSRQWASTIA